MSDVGDWTCEHGVVRGEGCTEYGCGGGVPDREPERNYAERLRLVRTEAALQEAEDKLGRLLRMADAWSQPGFPARDASVFAEAMRVVILP